MIRSRAYSGEADYQRLSNLLAESCAITGTLHNWSVDYWDWFRYNGHVFDEMAGARHWENGVRLWETSKGQLVAAPVLSKGDLTLQVHPRHRHIEAEMLDWAEQYHCESVGSGADSAPMEVSHSYRDFGWLNSSTLRLERIQAGSC